MDPRKTAKYRIFREAFRRYKPEETIDSVETVCPGIFETLKEAWSSREPAIQEGTEEQEFGGFETAEELEVKRSEQIPADWDALKRQPEMGMAA